MGMMVMPQWVADKGLDNVAYTEELVMMPVIAWTVKELGEFAEGLLRVIIQVIIYKI